MVRLRRLALYAALPLVAAPAVVAWRVVHGGGDAPTRPTYEQLVAKNYRVLTGTQSRTLVSFAAALHACLVTHGGTAVARPVASATRITMRAPGRSARELVRLLTSCDPAVGPPPAKSSLQARAGEIVLYLPKQCLLDPAQVGTTQS